MLNLIYENQHKTASLWYDSEHKILLSKISGKITTEEHREIFEMMITEGEKTSYSRVIFNNLDLIYDTPQARAWFVTGFLPKAYKTFGEGMRIAVVQPQSFFQKAAIGIIASAAKTMGLKFTVEYFQTQEEAIKWHLGGKNN